MAILVAAGPARAAPDYPVCVEQFGPYYVRDCRFDTLDQCRMVMAGRAGQCVVNPFYQPPAKTSRPGRGKHK